MRKLYILLALALLPTAALGQSLTLGNLKAPIAHASGKAPAVSTADLWDQINHLPAPAATPAPIPATVEQRLNAIDAKLAALTTAATITTPIAATPVADTLSTGWYDGGIWNWGARFSASEWAAPFSRIPFQYDHVAVLANGDVQMNLEPGAGAEIQARDGTPAVTAGLFEVDVDLPKAKAGVIQAPLWLYDKTTNSGDEIDFEVVGTKGMQVNLHANGQQEPYFFPGDWSGRHRLAIQLGAGFVELRADGKVLHRYTGPLMISHALKPMMSLWAVDPANGGMTGWSGVFTGFAAGEGPMYLTIHGYRYIPG